MKLTILRKWNNPKIDVQITNELISVSMELTEFILALALEVDKVTTILTRKTLDRCLQEAASRIISEMKNQTTKVI